MAHRSTNILTFLILLGLFVGALVGEFALYDPTGSNVANLQWLKEVGNLILIRPLKVLIVPLILFSVISGITRIGDPAKLGIVGLSTLVYYLATMFMAVTLGTILVTWISPGNLPIEVQQALIQTSEITTTIEQAPRALSSAWLNILYQVIPVNIFKDMVNGQPLGIIVFAIAFGLAITAGGEKTN